MDDQALHLLDLDDSLLVYLFSFCSGTQLANLTCTSKRLSAACNGDVLWRGAIAQEFVLGRAGASAVSVRSTYHTAPEHTIIADAGGFPLSSPDGRLPSLYRCNLSEWSLASVAWVDAHVRNREEEEEDEGEGAGARGRRGRSMGGAAAAPHPGPREGTAWAPVCGGDGLALLCGWGNDWPTMKNDVWWLDCNPWGETGSREYDADAAAIGMPEYGRDDQGNNELNSRALEGAHALMPEYMRVERSARALLAGRSPTRTGAVSMRPLCWAKCKPSGEPPRPRYGIAATGVLLKDSSIEALRSRGGGSSAGSRADEEGEDGNAAGAAGGGRARSGGASTPTSMPSSSPMLKLRSPHLMDGTHLQSAPIPPTAAASAGVPAFAYGSPPEGWTEAVVMTGGMFSGGYRNETGEVWLLTVRALTEAVAVPDTLGGQVKSGGGVSPTPEEEEEEEGDEYEDDGPSRAITAQASAPAYSTRSRAAAAIGASSTTTAVTPPAPPARRWKFAVRRRLACEWLRVHVSGKPASGDEALPSQASARGYHTASWVPSERALWISGGIADSDSVWALEAVDLDTWRVSPVLTAGPSPSPRHGHSMTPLRGRVWVFGGGTGGDILREGRDLRDLWCFDLKARCWAQVLFTPTPSAGPAALEAGEGAPLPPNTGRVPSWTGRCHTATPVGEQILVFGGSTDTSNRLFAIDTRGVCTDPSSGSVGGVSVRSPRVLGQGGKHCPSERYNHCAARVGRRVLIYGGWADGEALGDCSALDTCPTGVDILVDVRTFAHSEDVVCASAGEARRAWLGVSAGYPMPCRDAGNVDAGEDQGDEDDDDDDQEEEEEDGRGRGGRRRGQGGTLAAFLSQVLRSAQAEGGNGGGGPDVGSILQMLGMGNVGVMQGGRLALRRMLGGDVEGQEDEDENEEDEDENEEDEDENEEDEDENEEDEAGNHDEDEGAELGQVRPPEAKDTDAAEK